MSELKCVSRFEEWANERFENLRIDVTAFCIELYAINGYCFYSGEHTRILNAVVDGRSDWTGACRDAKEFLKQVSSDGLRKCDCSRCGDE